MVSHPLLQYSGQEDTGLEVISGQPQEFVCVLYFCLCDSVTIPQLTVLFPFYRKGADNFLHVSFKEGIELRVNLRPGPTLSKFILLETIFLLGMMAWDFQKVTRSWLWKRSGDLRSLTVSGHCWATGVPHAYGSLQQGRTWRPNFSREHFPATTTTTASHSHLRAPQAIPCPTWQAARPLSGWSSVVRGCGSRVVWTWTGPWVVVASFS